MLVTDDLAGVQSEPKADSLLGGVAIVAHDAELRSTRGIEHDTAVRGIRGRYLKSASPRTVTYPCCDEHMTDGRITHHHNPTHTPDCYPSNSAAQQVKVSHTSHRQDQQKRIHTVSELRKPG